MGYFKDDWNTFEEYVGIDPTDSTNLLDVKVDPCGERGEKQSVGGGATTLPTLPSELHFNGDTWISIPSFFLPIESAGRIEIEAQADNTSGHILWGSTEEDDYHQLDTGGGSNTIAVHPLDNSAGTAYTAGDRNIWSVTWDGGSPNNNFNVYKDNVSSVNTNLGDTAAAAGFRIGSFTGDLSVNMVGYLRDVKVYDAVTGGNLTHHWEIKTQVPDGGTIPDTGTVGGFDGTLNLGSGTWDIRYIPNTLEMTALNEMTITYDETVVSNSSVATSWGAQVVGRFGEARFSAASISSISGNDVVLNFTNGNILPGDTVYAYYIGDKLTTGGMIATKYARFTVTNPASFIIYDEFTGAASTPIDGTTPSEIDNGNAWASSFNLQSDGSGNCESVQTGAVIGTINAGVNNGEVRGDLQMPSTLTQVGDNRFGLGLRDASMRTRGEIWIPNGTGQVSFYLLELNVIRDSAGPLSIVGSQVVEMVLTDDGSTTITGELTGISGSSLSYASLTDPATNLFGIRVQATVLADNIKLQNWKFT